MAFRRGKAPLRLRADDDNNRIENKGTQRQTSMSRRVKFQQNLNQTVHVVPRNPREVWYKEDEYKAFKKLWRSDQLQVESEHDFGFCLELLGFQNTTMDMNQSIPKEVWLRREKLRNIVFKHQDECRLRGLYDPDGASVLSQSVSVHDLSRAQKSAAANAEEAEQYRKEISQLQSSPTSVSNFSLLNMNDLSDPLECALSFSCAKWQLDSIEAPEIMNYQRRFEDSDAESSEIMNFQRRFEDSDAESSEGESSSSPTLDDNTKYVW
eukprot:scaffold25826_cov132-Cylindrotheca_fusiformis.AAC.2